MLLVLKIGSRFFTLLSSPQAILPGMQFTLPVSRPPMERGFLIILRNHADLLLLVTLSCPPFPECNSFLTTSHSLLHVILAPSSALLPGSFSILWYKIFSFLAQCLIFFACLELVFY